jgi:hypothetical protein
VNSIALRRLQIPLPATPYNHACEIHFQQEFPLDVSNQELFPPEFGQILDGDSAWYCIEQTAARPKNGRPLQNLPPSTHGGFVAAVPSRAFRDGTGIFVF